MYLDAAINPPDLGAAALAAAGAERVGLHGIWTLETQHDPFLPLGAAALYTSRISLGTAIAVAFPRSPTVTAYTAWDLARASSGRFILGLGTQVKAHIERRFSVPWDSPVARLRDYIGAVRAVWETWQTGERLRYESEFYTLKLMTPFFSPDPLPYPDPPIYIAGVNKELCRLAGEVCQGFHVHPLHTARYLGEAILPWIAEGMVAAGRGRWDDMGDMITDDMLGEFVVEGADLPEAARALQIRYADLLDRASFYLPYVPGERDEEWAEAAALLNE